MKKDFSFKSSSATVQVRRNTDDDWRRLKHTKYCYHLSFNARYGILSICNNVYGVNIGQVTSSRLCRVHVCTNLRISTGISGVSRNNQNEGKISILGSQKSKKVTKVLHSHQWNLYQLYQNKIL